MERSNNNEKLKEYFSYEGRLNRKPYFLRWLGVLVLEVISFIIWGIAVDVNDRLALIFAILFIVFWLACAVFMLFQSIKRLHDLDKSGWYLLIRLAGVIPFIGFLIALAFDLYLLLAKGTEGPNRFGPDPLNPEGDEFVYDTEVYEEVYERDEIVYDADVYESDENVYDTDVYESDENVNEEEKREW